jgi:beta-glucosidase
MNKTISIFLLPLILLLNSCFSDKTPVSPYRDADLEARVEKTLKGMTLEEKAGQMVQLTISVLEDDTHEALDPAKLDEIFGEYKVGSILNVMNGRAHTREQTAAMIRQIQEKSMEKIGIPCIYGLDMVHGANYLTDGTIFPHEINLAATFDPSFARKMGEVTAYETRAAMVPWVFTPTVDLGRDPRWPRIWEDWGEDAYLASVMSVEETAGLQGDDPNHIDLEHVAANLKCFIAYSMPYTGKDRTPAYIPMHDLREKYFAPFLACFQSGALSIMVNSSSVNGIPLHSDRTLLTGWAKEETLWDGMIVTDWSDLNNLYERDHIAADKREAIKIGINAGIDMIMEPYDKECCTILADLARTGEIPMSRIDDAVRRILRMKYRAGLFDNPVWDTEAFDKFGSKEFAVDSYKAALESEVLLKNEGVLPVAKGKRILVAGPNANSLRTLNGGWSYTWQGEGDSYVPQYNTILEAMRNTFGEQIVIYEPGVTYDLSVNDWKRENKPEIGKAVAAARGADVILVCVGENSYCETPGNIDDLNLSVNQKDLVRALAGTGKPVILVLNEGRPRIIGDIEPLVKAVVDIMLPGNFGGDALAALLSGEENFSGKLPFTYSKHINALHTYDYKVQEHREMMDGEYNYDAVMDVQWPFGFGLSYTEYDFTDFKCLGSDSFSADDVLRFSVTVRNTGGRAGREAVLLYSSDLVASIIPDVKRLRAFTKVDLEAGESKEVTFEVPASSLAFVGRDGRWRLEEGDFRISCGGLSTMLHCNETKVWETPNIN